MRRRLYIIGAVLAGLVGLAPTAYAKDLVRIVFTQPSAPPTTFAVPDPGLPPLPLTELDDSHTCEGFAVGATVGTSSSGALSVCVLEDPDNAPNSPTTPGLVLG